MLSGLILAGGRSSRMGRDKAGLKLPDGRTLLQRQSDVLRAAGATTLIASVRTDIRVVMPGLTLVHDSMPDAGPLAGLAAGLRAAPGGRVVVLAVDMPGIGGEHLRTLIDLSTERCGVVPVLDGQIEPLVAVYPASLAASAAAALAGERRSVQAWAREEARKENVHLWGAPPEWAGAFRSWNTPADVPEQQPS